jgi:ABC-type Fe3+-hydroxamate transport system substrate-binding protein
MEDNIFLLIVPKESRDKASGLDFPDIISAYSGGWEDNSSYIKYTTSWMQCDNVIKQHLPLYQKAEEYLHDRENRYEEIAELLKEKTEQKRALNLQFYKKYSRFI